MSQDTPRYLRFRWQWFWILLAAVCLCYVGVNLWIRNQQARCEATAQSLEAVHNSLDGADPQTVISRLGAPTSSTQGSQTLELFYSHPQYPVKMRYIFRDGRCTGRQYSSMPWQYTHPIPRRVDAFSDIALGISLPLWLALAVGACFRHRYARLVSHLLLATACLILVMSVSSKPVSASAWLLGTVTITVGILAIRSSYRTPKDDTAPVCSECGYNLTGNVSGICPECGTPVGVEMQEALTERSHQNDVRGIS